MATFNEITEVVLYPIDIDADFVTFTGASALKAYNGFVNGRPFMATANGMSDPEVWWNSTAYMQMRVTRESIDIDMTDNFCEQAVGDALFYVPVNGVQFPVTEEMATCWGNSDGYTAGFLVDGNPKLVDGTMYSLLLDGQSVGSDTVTDGTINIGGFFVVDSSGFDQPETFIWIDNEGVLFETCEDAKAFAINFSKEHHLVLKEGEEPGPK